MSKLIFDINKLIFFQLYKMLKTEDQLRICQDSNIYVWF